ncbi:MAG: C39 family peptidase [Candidatus Doudnabacteria bacterium]|nr:C39 family peptidase [Candidatus Doudnabacteria bacterium]
MKIRNHRILIPIGCAVLILAAFLMYQHWNVLRYEVRLANIRLFQSGEVAGGTIVQLPATYHRQEHSLSCEIAALKMALSVFDINPSESELVGKLKFDPTPRTTSVWGDPFTGFVGIIDGKMGVDGYGVYADPILEVAKQYTNAQVIRATPVELAKQIDLGNPVVIWGYSGRGRTIKWSTPAGRQITAINGEHARTLIGYWGAPSAPIGFIILDPIYGTLKWKTADLMKNMQPFDYMAVVVSKP